MLLRNSIFSDSLVDKRVANLFLFSESRSKSKKSDFVKKPRGKFKKFVDYRDLQYKKFFVSRKNYVESLNSLNLFNFVKFRIYIF